MDLPGADADIDAVITWVDGGDPAHRQKLQAFLGSGARREPGAADPTRFGDCGEIEYCVASLLRHAPWLRRIHIVSDAQTPALMATLHGTGFESRVQVVDHRAIFAGYEQFLPTFSSLSIETMLWRIPGLAERFIYLNDDFQLLRPVAATDFFRDGGVVLRGKWRGGRVRRLGQRVKALWSHALRRSGKPKAVSNHTAQQLTAAMIGFHDRYFQVPHCPHPMRRSLLAAYFAEHPQQLAENLAYRLRAAEQFLLVGLADHLELQAGSALIDNRLGTLRLKPSSQGLTGLRRQLARADADPRLAFGCVQSLDVAGAAARQLVFDWLDRRVGRLEALLAR
jgi:hypothetical protein